jgi:hypothetical protein
MSGFAHIFGIFPCGPPRTPITAKPNTIAFDVEVIIRGGTDAPVEVLHAIAFAYAPLGSLRPADEDLFFIHGRVAGMSSEIPVGDGYSPHAYDFIIDVVFVSDSAFPPYPFSSLHLLL